MGKMPEAQLKNTADLPNLNNIPEKIQLEDTNVFPEEKHSEDMNEIITKVPTWILRWGISLLFILLFMAAGIMALIHYPDIVKVNVKITAVNKSLPVVSVKSGTLTKLFVKSGDKVQQGQKLCYIQDFSNQNEGYFLISPCNGTIAFIALVQPNSIVNSTQELFRVHPDNEAFFGLAEVSQDVISKIEKGQHVNIKLKGYPIDEYGQVAGKISYITDEPDKWGHFAVKIAFNKTNNGLKKSLALKDWMTGDADIVTADASLQYRLYKKLYKGLK